MDFLSFFKESSKNYKLLRLKSVKNGKVFFSNLSLMSFQTYGNLKFYEVDNMICTGNSVQGLARNALVSDVKGPIFIPEKISFFGVKRKVELIGNSSFQSSQVTLAYIPRFVKEIRRDSFIYCPLLEKVKFQKNSEVNFIGQGSFHNNEKLLEFFIPSSVKYIQYHALASKYFLNIFYCGTTKISEDVFQKDMYTNSNRKIYVTDKYPIATFGGFAVQEEKITCPTESYSKVYAKYKKKTIMILLIMIVLFV